MSSKGIKYEFIGTEGTGENLSVVFSRYNDNAPVGHRNTELEVNGTDFVLAKYPEALKISYDAARNAAVAAIVNDLDVPEEPVPERFILKL